MSTSKVSLLVIDDDPDILTASEYLLERHYETVVTCNNPGAIPELMDQHDFSVILLDMNFRPGESDGTEGMYWLKKIRELDPEVVVVVITAHGSVDIAVEAMKHGAADYLTKPWDNQRLLTTISTSLQLRQSRVEAERLRQGNKALAGGMGPQNQHLIGSSPAMKEVMSLIARAAPTEANVLILGENGTGKELVAREIHRQSKRSDQILIPVDLGAVSESLFESEMFGHKKGAFTDARENKVGYMEAASGGTLFLDEIGNIPLHLQAKLLSVLEKREVSPVGATKAIPVDVRIVAATNMPVQQLNDLRYFRQDLLFRLNTVEITLPPLRQRPGDIPELARYFVDLYCQKYGKPAKRFNAGTLDSLVRYEWPGNVRALRHAVERAVILSNEEMLGVDDFQLQSEHLKQHDTYVPADAGRQRPEQAENSREDPDAVYDPAGSEENQQQDFNLERVEYRTIIEALRKNRYVISHAAKDLGLTRAALYRRMEKYGI